MSTTAVPIDDVRQVLDDACTPLSAREIASDLGGRYGGRSVAGVLDQLVRDGSARCVPRVDGRLRPLLYELVRRDPAERFLDLARQAAQPAATKEEE